MVVGNYDKFCISCNLVVYEFVGGLSKAQGVREATGTAFACVYIVCANDTRRYSAIRDGHRAYKLNENRLT